MVKAPTLLKDRPLTQERLHELLHYDPLTGLFTNKVRRGKSPAGAVVGSRNKVLGYIVVVLDGRHYYGHRLAWFYVHGVWPALELDHKSRRRDENRLTNLREATKLEQQQNLKPRLNATGFPGVSKRGSRFRANILVGGKKVGLGTFSSAEEAGAAYMVAKTEMHPFYTHVSDLHETR